MNPNRPRSRTSASFEYFLYAAIIVETALAAFVYKVILRDPDLAHVSLYFGIFYFAFLAWSIAQLNNLHRRRKLAQADPTPGEIQPEEIHTEQVQPKQSHLEQAQLEQIHENRPAVRAHSRSALGLTAAQLVIVIVVFVTAVATFSWALKLLR